MKIKHLQLNTAILRSPEQVVNFILENDVDIANLQEIAYQIDGENPIHQLIKNSELEYIEGISFDYLPKNIRTGVGIITRFKVLDEVRLYHNSGSYMPKVIDNSSFEGDQIVNEEEAPSKFKRSRGLRNSVKSRCTLAALLEVSGVRLRSICTQFSVSDKCTELPAMYDMAKLLASFIDNSSDIPTILTGDLNIQQNSYSVNHLRKSLDYFSSEITDTLSNSHRAKNFDFPQGLATDHVFGKKIKHISTKAIDVEFADHKALISEFEI